MPFSLALTVPLLYTILFLPLLSLARGYETTGESM